MSRPYKNKPFPGELLWHRGVRPRHVFAFWILCNNFDQDEAGWIWTTRKEWTRVAGALIPVPIHNPTLILESLNEWGFIEFDPQKLDPEHRMGASHYRIRVCESAWDVKPEPEPVAKPDDWLAIQRKFYRDRYAQRKAKLLNA